MHLEDSLLSLKQHLWRCPRWWQSPRSSFSLCKASCTVSTSISSRDPNARAPLYINSYRNLFACRFFTRPIRHRFHLTELSARMRSILVRFLAALFFQISSVKTLQALNFPHSVCRQIFPYVSQKYFNRTLTKSYLVCGSNHRHILSVPIRGFGGPIFTQSLFHLS